MKSKKENPINISVFGYENKVKYNLCIKKIRKKHAGLLLTGKEGKRH